MALSRAGRICGHLGREHIAAVAFSRLPVLEVVEHEQAGDLPERSVVNRYRSRTARAAWSLSSSLVASICCSRLVEVDLGGQFAELGEVDPAEPDDALVGRHPLQQPGGEACSCPSPPMPCSTRASAAPQSPRGCLSGAQAALDHPPSPDERGAGGDPGELGLRVQELLSAAWRTRIRPGPGCSAGVTIGVSGDLSA